MFLSLRSQNPSRINPSDDQAGKGARAGHGDIAFERPGYRFFDRAWQSRGGHSTPMSLSRDRMA
jgi:hypothetical protein